MQVCGTPYRTVWLDPEDQRCLRVINQSLLPHRFETLALYTPHDVARVISEMHIRGAGCIGVTAAYGMYLGACTAPQDSYHDYLHEVGALLTETRPTAVNLSWAVQRMLRVALSAHSLQMLQDRTRDEAQKIADEDVAHCRAIGEYGLPLIEEIYARTQKPVEILTHCNAGWLAFVDHGSATAPIYAAHRRGIPVHVWVDVTGPRNQGSRLTAWELLQEGVPHTIIADNTGGYLFQHNAIDMVITGADCVTRQGDAANKIGTYLKALAAREHSVPFYVALPSSTFDFSRTDGLTEIPIEKRGSHEVTYAYGENDEGVFSRVRIAPAESPAANWGFDVTPARFITELITERGRCVPTWENIRTLFPEASSAG
ncbi:S-methyl-5-thioribose-1-phosphate isomerase [Chitinivibrio alkaliphilus]|uniref:Methylthioribose-1-phosphate isomerase n=1 Tax=Chitinivibrio alkaliphilus ACht1 TaxID=1313304 RepID=U7D4E8_9BACT|nr:S-methyl-5-thioribose-1-phosphate isomerase [Chitinivibrio alkaliphilus]ERP31364.1 S-methyl-5-thioribose-1-phosphate isomerase [Chitinivibrio alkaliphilus ACht1]